MKKRDYTTDEVADLLRVHEGTVRRWIRDGQLGAYQLPGGYYRVPAAELERLRKPVEAGK